MNKGHAAFYCARDYHVPITLKVRMSVAASAGELFEHNTLGITLTVSKQYTASPIKTEYIKKG